MRSVHRLGAMLALASLVCSSSSALAQRTRFPGDSPTRPAVMGGRVLGTPSGRRPVVPNFTIQQGGFRSFAYPGYYSFYNGTFPGFGAAPGFCSVCGCLPSGCFCSSGIFFPPRVVDYRTIYGFRAPMAINPLPIQPAIVARAPIQALAGLPPAPPMPERAANSRLKKAWRYIDLGDRYQREGRLRDAHLRYRRAASAAPGLADILFRQAFLELALGDIEQAADLLAKGLAQEPKWAESGFELATVYSAQGLASAQRLIGQRLRDFPNDADARLMAGVLLHLAGDKVGAKSHFDHAVRVTGGQSVARHFLEVQPEAADAAALVQ